MIETEGLLRQILPCEFTLLPPSSVPSERRFVIIPGLDGPRWIAPLDWSMAAPVLQQWSPIDPVSRAKWRAVLMAYRLGCIERIPGTTVVGLSDLDLSGWHKLKLTPSGELVPIIYVARPSTTRKAIVNLYSRARRDIECIVKIALGSHATQSIEQDFRNLQSLDRLTPGIAPRPIAMTSDRRAASQQWIAGKISLHPPPSLVECFLTTLWREQPTTLRDVAQRFRTRFEAFPHNELTEPIARIFDSITSEDRVPSAFYHGDFVSWNMVCQSRSQCCAIDWEFGEMEGAPLMDLFHFFLRFALAAGEIDSYAMAERLTVGMHRRLFHTVLDRIGASHRYLDDALALTLVALYVTRSHQICATDRVGPQLRAVFTTFSHQQARISTR